jgi:biopolymer transport protein ExbB/TolQ
MKFFERIGHHKRNILIIGLLAVVAVSLFIVFMFKVISYYGNSKDVILIENDNKILETEENRKGLFSEQNSDYIEEIENRKRGLDNRYKEIEQMALELNEHQKALELENYLKNDLLYKYEPYYIYMKGGIM